MDRKKIINGSNFKDIITSDGYYVDKTLFIKELIDNKERYALITRPRRFGKTMNLDMLNEFFDVREDSKHLFKDLEIAKHPEYLEKYQNKYPTIYISFARAARGNSYEGFLSWLKEEVYLLYEGYSFIIDSLKTEEKEIFEDFRRRTVKDIGVYQSALKFLSNYISIHYGTRENPHKVVILIDEYDVPISNGFYNGYYKEIVNFFSGFFLGGLKENKNVFISVITGCHRISKESIFTGFNNLRVHPVTRNKYSSYFGFNHEEVAEMAKYFNLEDKLSDIEAWYDGYLFGNTKIYNPWSIMEYMLEPDEGFSPYWGNTSSNTEIRQLISSAPSNVLDKINILLNGGIVESAINDNIVYNDLKTDDPTILSFLLSAGYLKYLSRTYINEGFIYKLAVPNVEVKKLLGDLVLKLANPINNKMSELINALLKGSIKTVETTLNEALRGISYYDSNNKTDENAYHLFLFGYLVERDERFIVLSNRESGEGRYDLCIKPKISESVKTAVIVEVKTAIELVEEAASGLAQIEEKQYYQDLLLEGYEKILMYGIAFARKQCAVAFKEYKINK